MSSTNQLSPSRTMIISTRFSATCGFVVRPGDGGLVHEQQHAQPGPTEARTTAEPLHRRRHGGPGLLRGGPDHLLEGLGVLLGELVGHEAGGRVLVGLQRLVVVGEDRLGGPLGGGRRGLGGPLASSASLQVATPSLPSSPSAARTPRVTRTARRHPSTASEAGSSPTSRRAPASFGRGRRRGGRRARELGWGRLGRRRPDGAAASAGVAEAGCGRVSSTGREGRRSPAIRRRREPPGLCVLIRLPLSRLP